MSKRNSSTKQNLAYLKKQWWDLLTLFNQDESAIQKHWDEIFQYYSKKDRAYHNLNHLFDIFTKLENHTSLIHDLPTIQLAIWYHDIIYQTLSKHNEVKSAVLCSKRLKEMNIDSSIREKVFKLICSTKKHEIEAWETETEKSDNAYLLDLDLSILGSLPEEYQKYVLQIRKEYKIVPSILYNRGRKKVLAHFSKMDRIFKTEIFHELYEENARKNIEDEQ